MSLGVQNIAMLLGLTALAIPIVLHFLQRRRFDVVDWGAMQFLQISNSQRRKWWWDDALLLLVRLALIAALVVGLAGPFAQGEWLDQTQLGARRDFILVIDPSASMGAALDGPTMAERATQWANRFLTELREGDRAAIILAGQPPRLLVEPTDDIAWAKQILASLPEPAGGSDWPRALELALDTAAQTGARGESVVYLLRDRQKNGWADADAVDRWERLVASRNDKKTPLFLPDLSNGAALAKTPLNFWLAAPRLLATAERPGQPREASCELHWLGDAVPPEHVLVTAWIDGVKVDERELVLVGVKSGQPVVFKLPLDDPGERLVTFKLDAASGAKKRGKDRAGFDALATDNELHFVVDVLQNVPVLLVDGESKLAPGTTTFFLENALRGDEGPAVLFAARSVPWGDLSRATLFDASGPLYRVLVLSDVPRLSHEQQAAVEEFLNRGGSVLVALGPRAAKESDWYNKMLYRDGLGWLPARLEKVAGNEKDLDKAARIDSGSLTHPALTYFRDAKHNLDQVRLPRWIQLNPAPAATTAAALSTGGPYLVEKPFGAGHVLLAAAPLDRSWSSDFPQLNEYPIFVHRMLHYLAESGAASWRVLPGQVLQWQPPAWAKAPALPLTLSLTQPDGGRASFVVAAWPWIGPELHRPGAYRLQIGPERHAWFVVPWDERESNLTPASQAERNRVTALLDLTVVAEPSPGATTRGDPQSRPIDLWWLLLFVVIAFLGLEVWLTRRRALASF